MAEKNITAATDAKKRAFMYSDLCGFFLYAFFFRPS
jgi:hypothetical protein